MPDLLDLEEHRCRILRGPCLGLMYAQNTLLMASKKRLVARLDDDTVPHSQTLEQLIQLMIDDKMGRSQRFLAPFRHSWAKENADYRNFVERVRTIGQGAFPWERERQATLEPFQKWLELGDDARGYIER